MYIAIEGNIGAGKSTIANALAKKLNAHFLPEKFEENTLLPLFYENKKKLALLTEFSFLIDRQNQLSTYFKKHANKITVSDFHFDKCICFAKANLKASDFKLYKKNFNQIKLTITNPDLVVYLNVKTDLLLKNIKKRGRVIEKNIQEDYLEKVNKSYQKHYSSKKNLSAKMMVITLMKYDSHTTNECCSKIMEVLKLK
jgi:deoxyadenosine/deoxycytidine kinase